LCEARTGKDVKEALRRLPEDLYPLYDEIYKRIRKKSNTTFRLAEKTIQWLLYSRRHLSSREMLCAVLSGSHERLNISPTHLVDVLANLIILEQETDVFRFIHPSVREYLQRHVDFNPGKCHTTILQRCLQTYNLKCLGDFSRQSESHQQSENEERSALAADLDYSSSSEGLESYAAHHWLTHLRLANRQDVDSGATLQEMEAESSCTAELETFLLHPSAPYLLWTADAEGFPTEVDETEGFPTEVDETLELSPTEFGLSIESTYCNPQGPQFVMCAFGLLPILVSILGQQNLKGRNLDWNLKNNRGLTPLVVALSNKDINTGEILISFGANIDARDEEDATQGTLLHTIVAAGDVMAVDFLVKRGANLAERNADQQTPLNVAAEQGGSQIVKVLLDADADIDTRDIDGLTPLLSSVRKGHTTAARLLIENGAMIEAWDSRRRRTPLHWAAAQGETQILRLLLEKKCSLNARDYQHSTPIILSLENEQNEATTLLLEAGADLKNSNSEDMTPLQAALQVEDTPCISDYIAAPQLGPPGFISRGAQATTEILRNVRVDSNVSMNTFASCDI
jgi:ankyrin repeat protein